MEKFKNQLRPQNFHIRAKRQIHLPKGQLAKEVESQASRLIQGKRRLTITRKAPQKEMSDRSKVFQTNWPQKSQLAKYAAELEVIKPKKINKETLHCDINHLRTSLWFHRQPNALELSLRRSIKTTT